MSASSRVGAKYQEYICPATQELLTEAMLSEPCGHRIQKSAVTRFRLFCASCRGVVSDYSEDISYREKVKKIFGPQAPQEVFNTVFSNVRRLREGAIDSLPYPGGRGSFSLSFWGWERKLSFPWSDRCREIRFNNSVSPSFIRSFQLLGYKDGGIALVIYFDPKVEGRSAYLLKWGVLLRYEHDPFYSTEEPTEIRALLKMLEENNDIPEKKFTELREIVEKNSSPGQCEWTLRFKENVEEIFEVSLSREL